MTESSTEIIWKSAVSVSISVYFTSACGVSRGGREIRANMLVNGLLSN